MALSGLRTLGMEGGGEGESSREHNLKMSVVERTLDLGSWLKPLTSYISLGESTKPVSSSIEWRQ